MSQQLSCLFNLFLACWKNGTQDPGKSQDPMRTHDFMRTQDPRRTQDRIRIQDPMRTQDPMMTQNSSTTQEKPRNFDFHIMCLIWWNLQLKADLFIIVECLHAVNRYIRNS